MGALRDREHLVQRTVEGMWEGRAVWKEGKAGTREGEDTQDMKEEQEEALHNLKAEGEKSTDQDTHTLTLHTCTIMLLYSIHSVECTANQTGPYSEVGRYFKMGVIIASSRYCVSAYFIKTYTK